MKIRLICFVLAALVLIPGVSSAYIPSPQYGAFELKFGPYKPNVDDEPGLDSRVYENTFNNKSMFLTVIEIDYQFWHPPGVSLGIGASVGFMQASAKSTLQEGSPGGSTDTSDYTVLNVIPMALMLVVRVDILADKFNVPLVPYGKIGLNWYVWWILNGGEMESAAGEGGSGGTFGWQGTVGLAFLLDVLDPMTARTFDNEVGVNHTYLFAELMWAKVENFGTGDCLYLSTDNFIGATVLAGLAIEF
jgi:hypothetical protein